jgi:formate hydrogenlyase subunit 3/multisubunit Na+/H+ antiporter MnhD subunit
LYTWEKINHSEKENAMENKKSKTGGIVGTLAAVFLCGCPGLFLCIFGVWTATGKMPYTTSFNDYSGGGMMPSWAGYAMLCGSILLIAVPIVVGLMTLRDKKPKAVAPSIDEPLPPAS